MSTRLVRPPHEKVGLTPRMFSTLWKIFSASFPHYGKLFEDFSTVWKTFSKFFHAMENFIRMGENGLKNPVFSGI
jgi:hypothetical protein